MGDRATAVNPRMLVWARQRAGYGLDDVAAKLKKPPETIASWEDGSGAPTFRQLEELAEVLYKRPVALFFFPNPPPEPSAKSQFRTLPASELQDLEPDTLYAVREALGFRESLRELAGGNPVEHSITRDMHADLSVPVAELASSARAYLKVSLDTQFSWASAEDAFKEWRRSVEAAGVFVFKRAFKQQGISGFCLYDEAFPLVVINNSTAHARQTFTLFHELGHLLFWVGGITKDDLRYIRRLTGTNRDIEVACNRFAAESLVPEASFPWREFQQADVFSSIDRVADRYRVSREVILRRLLDRGLVDEKIYDDRVAAWNKEFQESRAARAAGGNYYATQATYLGERYLQLAFAQYYAGRVSLEELAGHLGVKARNVPRLEDFLTGAR